MWRKETHPVMEGWEGSMLSCEALSFAGYDDWRLPNIKELQSIVDYAENNPAVNNMLVVQNDNYWSSTTYVKEPGKALCVNFTDGGIDGKGKAERHYVHAVRSGSQEGWAGEILTPVQGSSWNIGRLMPIIGTKIFGSVKILISRHGGKAGTFETIAEGFYGASHVWEAVSGPVSVNCMLKIEFTKYPYSYITQGMFSIVDEDIKYHVTIGSVSPSQSLKNETSALIYAEDVVGKEEIVRVWAEIKPPDWEDSEVLPSINLVQSGGGRYEAVYENFTAEGTYEIHIYAEDSEGNHSQGTKITIVRDDTFRKAIILAGGGPGDWNLLWDATRRCADYAYRALTTQGYDEDTVYYLSAGPVADTDAEAVTANFEYAVKTWARDTKELFIYMVDHGGEGTFRMNADEVLRAEELDEWLDELQQTVPGKVVVLYDACQAGSFLPLLLPPPGKERVLAASADSDEQAVFANNGNDSFSYRFFGNIFNGDKFYEAFVYAKKSIQKISEQRPRIDVNGNGVGSEDEDIELAGYVKITDELELGNDIPVIGNLSPSQTLEGEVSALLYAENVSDADGIDKVWAVIMPPDYSDGSPDVPVIPPAVELSPVGDDRFETTYNSFTDKGVYTVGIYAVDKRGGLGLVELPRQRRSVT